MEYIKQCDHDYIIHKYHEPKSLKENENRFIRNDALFSASDGKAPEEIMEQIRNIADDPPSQHHCMIKATAFECVLKNTRINCDRRDRFPAVNMIDRPLDKVFRSMWHREVFIDKIPETAGEKNFLTNNGIVTIWPDYDHSVPVWDRIFALGFSGLLRESESARDTLAAEKTLTPAQTAFFDSVKITYGAIIDFVGRLADLAESTDGSARMAKALRNIQHNAPETFYEALLVSFIYFMLSEHIDGLQVRSLSNFDRVFYAFYKHDLENGVTEQEIRTDLAYFFLQFTSIGNYWNQPVFLGGCKADGSTEINELSYLFLDVYDKMGIYNPKIQIKFADSTPKSFTLKALDMIRRGRNCIVFVSDALIRKALVRAGATETQARTCDIKGCYEYAVQGAFGAGMNYLNLLKPLEFALHEGKDGVNFKECGLKCRGASEYNTFDELMTEYKRQLENVIDRTIKCVNEFEEYHEFVSPQPMLSATYPACLKSGKDAMAGGALYNVSSLMFGFLADIADSLTMIKSYVFDKKLLTLSELTEILDKNFEGAEKLRRKLYIDPEKYGNNRDLPDSIAKDIAEFAVSCVMGRPNARNRGGKWTCGFHVARQSYTQGKLTAASANGRLKGEELSKNVSASMGQNREGATAAVLSATKIDALMFTGDACLDLGLLPSAVKGEDGLDAMYGLLKTFIKRGGHAMQINVFDTETLRAAQREPEKYSDLQIRVCGWNVLFNNINKTEQDGFIRQAESLV